MDNLDNVNAACQATIDAYTQQQRDALANTGSYARIDTTPITVTGGGTLTGKAVEYMNPQAAGVEAVFIYVDAGGVKWIKTVNFGPETERDRDWTQIKSIQGVSA